MKGWLLWFRTLPALPLANAMGWLLWFRTLPALPLANAMGWLVVAAGPLPPLSAF